MDAVHNDYLTKILTAQVYDVAIESPLELAPLLSMRCRAPCARGRVCGCNRWGCLPTAWR